MPRSCGVGNGDAMTEQQCSRCRTANLPHAAFCNGCGAALAPAQAAERPDAAPSGWALATAGMQHAPDPGVGSGALRREELASWWARLGASIVDGILVLLVVGLGAAAVGLVGYLVDPEGVERLFGWLDGESFGGGAVPSSDGGLVWLLLVGVVILVAYAVWEVAWIRSARFMGRPGQLVAGFRVVRADGLERLSLGRAIGRAASKLMYNVPNVGFLATIASAFTIGLTERKQALHDMIGGTVCVRKDALARRGIGPDASNEALVRQGEWRSQSPGGAMHGVAPGPAPLPSHAPAGTPPPAAPPPPAPPAEDDRRWSSPPGQGPFV